MCQVNYLDAVPQPRSLPVYTRSTRSTTMSRPGVQTALHNVPRVVIRPTWDNIIAASFLVKVRAMLLSTAIAGAC